MVPLVSDRYKYILFYNPKSACSVARQLFLRLHKDELSDIQRAELDSLKEANQDEWHNVNTMFPLRINNKAGVEEFEKYSDYYKFTLVRHPITRFISAYLNRIVLQQTDLDKIRRFLLERYGKGHNVDYSFKQFLQFFDQSNTDNAHFLPQSNMKGGLSGYSLISPFREKTNELDLLGGLKRRLLKASAPKVLKLDEVCKVETLQSDFLRVYKKVFAEHEGKLEEAVEAIKSLPFHNVTLSSDEVISDAASLSAEELRQMERMPAYENFVNPQVEKILARRFEQDYRLFGYSTSVSSQVVKFEREKAAHFNDVLPADFEWRGYLAANADLGANGIDTKVGAVSHWIHHGQYEDRKY